MDPVLSAVLGAAAALALTAIAAAVKAGSLGNVSFGLAVAGKSAKDAAFAQKLQALMAGAEPAKPAVEVKPASPPPPPKPSGVPLRMLALLQSESRLVDFLMEDVQEYSDELIGRAVREVHKKAHAALVQHAEPDPILKGKEGDTITVPAGFDPSAIRVIGNVTGFPPFTGTIQHPGWRVNELKLSAPPASSDEFVLHPAEVQVQ